MRRFKTTPYQRGYAFERRVRKWYAEQGWFAVRQPRSAFPDIIALKDGQIHLTEARVDGYLSPDERRLLKDKAKQAGGKPLIAYRKGRKLLFKEP